MRNQFALRVGGSLSLPSLNVRLLMVRRTEVPMR